MRLDVFLKTSRLVKRRAVAKELCDAGRIRIGGFKAKPARELKVGDILTLELPRRRLVAEVLELPAKSNVSKDMAASLYKIIEDIPKKEDF